MDINVNINMGEPETVEVPRPIRTGASTRNIRAMFEKHGPMTCGEIELQTGYTHQGVSGRIRDLVLLGELHDTGCKRVFEPTGRPHTVWALQNPHPKLFEDTPE